MSDFFRSVRTGIEKRLLPVVKSQPGRLFYRCRTVIHVKSRSDLQTDEYSVQLTTLYDSNQRRSYIRNEVAQKHVLRYVQVPERIVDISSAAPAKTTKLIIQLWGWVQSFCLSMG